jgi:hypothetical protein
MARPEKNVDVKITFGEFVAPEKVNPYAETVKKVADLNNDKAAFTVEVDVADAVTVQHKIQRAANDIGKTARLRLKDEAAVTVIGKDEDGAPVHGGPVKLTFTIGTKHKGRRGIKPVEESEAAPEAKAK